MVCCFADLLVGPFCAGDPWSEVVKGCYALVDDFHFERVAVVDPSLTAAARSARPQKAMLVMHVSSLRCHGGVGIGTVGDPMDLNCRNDVVCALRGEKRAEPNREHGGSGGAAAGAASGAQIVGVDGSGRTTGYIASMMRVPMCQFVFAPPVHTDAAVESDLPFRHDGQLTKPTVDPATIQGVVDLAEMSATVVAEQRAAVQQAEDSVGAGAATPADATANHQTLSITGVSQKRVDTQELLAGFVSAARAETQPSHSAPWPGEAADQVAERDAVPDVDLDAEMLAGQEPIEVDECSSSEDERGAGAPAGVEATSIATATGFKLPRSDTAQLCGSTGQSHLAEAERMGPDVCSSVALMDLPEDGVPDNHAVGEAEAPTPPKSVQKTSDADHAADGPSAVHTRRLPSASSPFPLGQATPVGVAGALSPVSESDESEDLEASGSPITPKQPVPSQRRPLPGAFDDVSQLTFQTSTSMEASLSPSGEVWKTRMEPPHVAPSAESVGTSDSPRAQNRQARSAMENSERRTKSLPRRARKRSRHASPRRLVVLPHPAQPVGHLKAMLLMRGSQREVALNAAFEMSWDVSRVSASVDAGAHGAYAAGHRGKFSIVADASGPSQSAGRLQRKFLCRDKHEAYRARNSATGRLKSPALLSPLGSLPSSSSSSGASVSDGNNLHVRNRRASC